MITAFQKSLVEALSEIDCHEESSYVEMANSHLVRQGMVKVGSSGALTTAQAGVLLAISSDIRYLVAAQQLREFDAAVIALKAVFNTNTAKSVVGVEIAQHIVGL